MAAGNFLFVTWAGGGNVHPLIALGTRLLARGHDVRVLGPAELARRFETEGLGFRAHRTREEWNGGAVAAGGEVTEEQRLASLRGLADDVLAEAGRAPVDVCVVDYMQPQALSAAELLDVPVTAFVHTLYQRVALGERTPMQMYGDVDAMNQLRRDLGLPPVASITDLLDRAARVLVCAPVELDRPESPSRPNVRHVGPLIEEPGPDVGWTPPAGPDDEPLVHVCMGTVVPGETAGPLIQRVLDALADLPVRVHVATCGPDEASWPGAIVDADTLRRPANATISGYVRHSAVLPHVRLFVTHAGLGSVGAALTFGVPMVCIPVFNEQPENAEHVAALGAGRTLSPEATVVELRTALTEMLADDVCHRAAQRVAASVREHGGAARAVDALEELLP